MQCFGIHCTLYPRVHYQGTLPLSWTVIGGGLDRTACLSRKDMLKDSKH